MRSKEITGKTVDEAIFKGLDEMSLSIDEVDIEILEEGGKRLFGIGSKPCRIRLTERDRESAEEQMRLARRHEEEERKRRETHKTVQKADRRDDRQRDRDRKPKDRQRPRQERQAHPAADRDNEPRRPRRSKDRDEAADAKPFFEGEPAEMGPEGEFLQGMLQHMGIECDITCLVNKEMDTKCFNLSGKGMGVLIGRRGETMNALQYLCSLVANKGESDYRRIIVDTENYRGRREGALIKLAESKAGIVSKTGRSMKLEPMNPYDRRVLHSALQNNPDVKTHSEGDEPNRRVVISKR